MTVLSRFDCTLAKAAPARCIDGGSKWQWPSPAAQQQQWTPCVHQGHHQPSQPLLIDCLLLLPAEASAREGLAHAVSAWHRDSGCTADPVRIRSHGRKGAGQHSGRTLQNPSNMAACPHPVKKYALGLGACLPAAGTAVQSVVSGGPTQVLSQGCPRLTAAQARVPRRPEAAQIHLDALKGHLAHVPAAADTACLRWI